MQSRYSDHVRETCANNEPVQAKDLKAESVSKMDVLSSGAESLGHLFYIVNPFKVS